MKKIIITFLLVLILFVSYAAYKQYLVVTDQKTDNKIGTKISDVTDYVITNKRAKIYIKKGEKYQEGGFVEKDIYLELDNIPKKEYLKLKHLDKYIHYQDVKNTQEQEISQRYKEYVVWNESVVTQNVTKFYDENDKLVFEINEKLTLPIIIKEDNKYGVEYNNQLLYVKDKTVIISNNSTAETRTDIRTLTYHTVYIPGEEECASIEICHPITQFEEQMEYLAQNKYLTLSLEEVEMFVDKKIQIPKKSIALTLDDGILLKNSIPIVEKNKVIATFFIITSKEDVTKNLDSPYAKFESHSDDLHNNYRCPLNAAHSQGGQMLCESEENIIKDLKLSQEKLNGSKYFAYPFFDFNDHVINALKKAGFTMAFIGQWNTDGYSTYDTNRFMMRRKTVFGNLSLDGFVEYLK